MKNMQNRKYSVKFTPIAMSDLDDIYMYIAVQLNNEISADGIINKIKGKVKQLEDFPLSAPLVQDYILQCKGYRMLVVDKYRIFYEVDDNLVIIMRILYGSRDYTEIL
ncbi:MAG: type II toxin-antitoxin system RelE/ParE family toxin [Deferribacteraceae bacterium]|jgi:addiction module RelE/StbE family toxin|nr:type II toxin-antitoxin system RelE/ParE family toxin [Deferribacteraceae bacterium]